MKIAQIEKEGQSLWVRVLQVPGSSAYNNLVIEVGEEYFLIAAPTAAYALEYFSESRWGDLVLTNLHDAGEADKLSAVMTNSQGNYYTTEHCHVFKPVDIKYFAPERVRITAKEFQLFREVQEGVYSGFLGLTEASQPVFEREKRFGDIAPVEGGTQYFARKGHVGGINKTVEPDAAFWLHAHNEAGMAFLDDFAKARSQIIKTPIFFVPAKRLLTDDNLGRWHSFYLHRRFLHNVVATGSPTLRNADIDLLANIPGQIMFQEIPGERQIKDRHTAYPIFDDREIMLLPVSMAALKWCLAENFETIIPHKRGKK